MSVLWVQTLSQGHSLSTDMSMPSPSCRVASPLRGISPASWSAPPPPDGAPLARAGTDEFVRSTVSRLGSADSPVLAQSKSKENPLPIKKQTL
jgi:hypothetical protein